VEEEGEKGVGEIDYVLVIESWPRVCMITKYFEIGTQGEYGCETTKELLVEHHSGL
jgi:hypothetical protein